MELYATDTHFILLEGEESLWIDRLNGGCQPRSDTGLTGLGGAEPLGTVYGYIGKLSVSPTSDTRLIFIRGRNLVGHLKNDPIYRISSVLAIPFEGDVEISMEQWNGVGVAAAGSCNPTSIATSASPTRQHGQGQGQGQGQSGGGGPPGPDGFIRVKVPPVRGLGVKKMESKVDRRMLEEFHKMFTEAESFYYSPKQDITNSLQRAYLSQHPKVKEDKEGAAAAAGGVAAAAAAPVKQNSKESSAVESESKSPPTWEMVDKRFFWNYYMVKSLINSEDKKLHRWILPIIQGFIQYEPVTIEHIIDPMGGPEVTTISAPLDIWLISRRSRFQAGTRYNRRGVDDSGRVANYVETEQIIVYKKHVFSFVQVRGSIPVFWSQSNSYRYRPPPKIEREEAETFSAFAKHFDQELSAYERIVVVNLVEKGGKEKVLGDAYTKNVLQLNSPKLTYVSFDFHDQCRGMKFDNVSNLTNRLADLLKKMGYCWIDPYGMVLGQEGVFRVNCVDCLDRTNVVQTHLAREMLTFELSKVGLIAPEIGLPFNVRKVLQVLWANNGDTISKQYAGTNALKGDFTRTGERKFAGVMKDGMNSANRYYLNRFRDTSRQAAIDLMLGVRKSVTEADLGDDEKQEEVPFEKDVGIEQLKSIIEDVKRCVIPPEEVILGSWGLVNGRLNEPDILDADSIVILTENNYYVTEYDCDCAIDAEVDTMTETVRIPLSSVTNMELSFDPVASSIQSQSQATSTTVWSIFSNSNSGQHQGQGVVQTWVPNLKINFTQQDEPQGTPQSHHHEFRSSNVRFFNNVAVPIQQPEEMQEALKMVSESIKIAASAHGNNVEILVIPHPSFKDPTSSSSSNSNKTRIPGTGIASNFVNKYLHTNAGQGQSQGQAQALPVETSIAQKLSAASFDRLKYFRRGSGGELLNGRKDEQDADGGPLIIPESLQSGSAAIPPPNRATLHLTDTPRKKAGDFPHLMDLNLNPLTPNLTYDPTSGFHIPIDLENDLILPSCGILSPGRLPSSLDGTSRRSNILSHISSLLPPPPSGVASTSSPDPDPEADPSLLTSEYIPSPTKSISPTAPVILLRHRYSLPANSLQFHPPTHPGPGRTPEITITEEIINPALIPLIPPEATILLPPSQSSLKVTKRRISRSSEEVNKVGVKGFGFSMPSPFGGHGSGQGQGQGRFKLPNIFQSSHNNQSSNKSGGSTSTSTSQQNIFDPVGLKGSHSDNALRENQLPPTQTPHQPRRDMVLAPLGKLAKGMQSLGANYLDPRKIRESLKPVGLRQGGHQDSVEDKELEERKRLCETEFIHV